jgi:hypothetical protein
LDWAANWRTAQELRLFGLAGRVFIGCFTSASHPFSNGSFPVALSEVQRQALQLFRSRKKLEAKGEFKNGIDPQLDTNFANYFSENALRISPIIH